MNVLPIHPARSVGKSLSIVLGTTLLGVSSPGIAGDPEPSPVVSGVGQTIFLPFHLNKNGFPLIEGVVDETKGVFLFDTGNTMRFLLNRNYIPLDTGEDVSRGTFASGQVVVVKSHLGQHQAVVANAIVQAASSGSKKAPDATMSIDASQQQKNIDNRLLGWVGWGFFNKYRMTIDYTAMTIRLDPLGSDSQRTARPKSAAVIRFTPASPVVPFFVKVGNESIPAIIDTAGRDEIALSPETWKRVRLSGLFNYGPGKQCVSIKNASLGGVTMNIADLEQVERSEERLTLGIDFLQRFTSHWNSSTGTVTLVANNSGKRKPKNDCT